MDDLFFDKNLPQLYYISRSTIGNEPYTKKFSVSYRLLYLYKGKIFLKTQGEEYNMQAGDVVLLLPNINYSTEFYEEQNCVINLFFGFDSKASDKLIFDIFNMNKAFCTKKTFSSPSLFNNVALIKNFGDVELLTRIYEQFKLSNNVAGLKTQAIFYDILLRLNNKLNANNKKNLTVVDKIKLFILDNITDKLKVEEIAKLLGYHANYINQLFVQHEGSSLKKYILKSKIYAAMRYLSENDMQITEIAFLLNFSDSSHFSMTFKKFVGISPTNFRKNSK